MLTTTLRGVMFYGSACLREPLGVRCTLMEYYIEEAEFLVG